MGTSKAEFSMRLKALMKQRKISLKSLAQAMAVSPSVAHGWLNGHAPRDYRKLMQLLDFFGVTLFELLGPIRNAEDSVEVPLRSHLELTHFRSGSAVVIRVKSLNLQVTLEPLEPCVKG